MCITQDITEKRYEGIGRSSIYLSLETIRQQDLKLRQIEIEKIDLEYKEREARYNSRAKTEFRNSISFLARTHLICTT